MNVMKKAQGYSITALYSEKPSVMEDFLI